MVEINEIRAQIAEAATEAGRDEKTIAFCAVSKQQPIERVKAALAAGQRLFGENRVQEAADKWPLLRETYPDVQLHLIGPLQTNKVKQALGLFDAVQSVDRERLARKIAQESAEGGFSPKLYIQVNTGEEPQKSGILPRDADAFVQFCQAELSLNIVGLMAIPPAEENPAPHFALLAKIAARNELRELSMGMSGDFPIAIAHGATMVRVGSAAFGARNYG